MNPSFSGTSLAATRSWGSSNGSGSPYVRDGQWSTAWYTVSSPASGQFSIDYGRIAELTGVRWGFNASNLTDQFTVETSTDRQTWSHVGTFGNGEKFTWYGSALGRQGRYLRVTFSNPNGDARVGYMAEIQLWGTESSVTTAGISSPTATPTPSPTATSTPPPASPTQAVETIVPTPSATTLPPTATSTVAPASPTATPTEPVETPASTEGDETAEPTEVIETPVSTGIPETESPTEQADPVVTGAGYIAFTDGAGANCRIAPDETGEVISLLPEGTWVETVGEPIDGWQRVLCNGQDGYVFAEFLSDTPPDEATEPVGTSVATETGIEPDLTTPEDQSETP